MMYVVGYNRGRGFVVLYETHNVRLALLKAQRLRDKYTEEIKIKKKA